MPRKQNGFGSTKGFNVSGVNSRTDKGKAKGAAGLYPSQRRYGSSVNRSVIEKYDLDSDWVKWRKGFEYYNQAAWYRLQSYDDYTQTYSDTKIESKLYQGTSYEVDVVFDGYKFATKGADSNNHYVMKRTTVSETDLGVITQVNNDALKYPVQKANRQIWTKGTPGADARLLFHMIGERLTDGETEATLDFLLDAKGHPSLYIGKSYPEDLTEVTATVASGPLMNSKFIKENNGNLQALVGKIVYIPEFFVEKPIGDVDSYSVKDESYYFLIEVEDSAVDQTIKILDTDSPLPPSLYDIAQLDTIYTENSGTYKMSGTYVYEKDKYQYYYGNQYLTGELVMEDVDNVSYTMMPYTILGVEQNQIGQVLLKSVPFSSEIKLYHPAEGGWMVFTDYSFTKTSVDSYSDEYYHQLGAPGSEPWMRIDTDIDPWMDEVFTSGNPLKPATVYTCSCPNHSHAILRAPQDSEDEGSRKINRQRRYPLPTVLGQTTYDGLALNQAAGVAETWESREHRMSFKMCKHSIAAMFIEHIKVQEPNQYPSYESRLKFEEKLKKDIEEVGQEFVQSYKRGGITALEVVFALAQGLNLDDVELAYVLLSTNF